MYSQILASGSDANSFLQGQLTQDLKSVTERRSPLAAWCNPKGRVIATLRLLALPDGIALVLPSDTLTKVIDGFTRYRMRARVELRPSTDGWRAIALHDERDLNQLQAKGLLPDNEAGASCHGAGISTVSMDNARTIIEVYTEPGALEAASLNFLAPLASEQWRAMRIRAGIADIDSSTTELYTPHMLNLDQHGAISFAKGCYTGQEIVARTEHLGNAKRRVAIYRSTKAIAVGEQVTVADKVAGQVVASAANWQLVILPLELHGKTLNVGDQELQPADQTSGRI